MKLSVIVPAYVGEHNPFNFMTLMQALISLQATAKHPHEYIVQDDSPRSLIPYIHPCIASAEHNPVNLGFGGNCNVGSNRASGDILLFFNQDCYGVYGLSDGWDEALLRAFENPKVGIVGGRLLFPNGSIQHAGIHFDGKCQPTHRYLGYADKDYPPANVAEEVPAVTGAVLAIRAELFRELGGFDTETYHKAYFEDVDLCARVVQAGYAVWYEPSVTFIHTVGSTGGSPYFMQNAMAFKQKWVDTGMIEPDIRAVKENFWS